ncbi:MAG: aminoglycoside phosphotransferase family protein [Bacteroidales bacterium]|nr:aminoglycoside phosphotransferase family protein [Bacteroidales bacterium]
MALRFDSQKLYSIESYGSGHINDTFLVNRDQSKPFILQRINTKIFREAEKMMCNIELVTQHIAQQSTSSENATIQLIYGSNKEIIQWDETGSAWRAMSYIAGSQTIDTVENDDSAHEAGRITGLFHQSLKKLDAQKLYTTLPDFHSLILRKNQFEDALDKDAFQRAKNIPKELEVAETNIDRLLPYDLAIANLPKRVTHNDPKINNILFDKNMKGICMIDLDTVMPGSILHDFGDAIRTSASKTSEDEVETSKAGIQLEFFEAWTSAWLSLTKNMLSPEEKNILPIAPQLLTFIIGLRFLTDYLNGDIYYKTTYETHNLVRARSQFAMLADMEKNQAIIHDIIKKHDR